MGNTTSKYRRSEPDESATDARDPTGREEGDKSNVALGAVRSDVPFASLDGETTDDARVPGSTPEDVAAVSTVPERRACADPADRYEWTPLHLAVLYRRWDDLVHVLDSGARPDSGETATWTTPLITAIGICEYAYVRALLDAGADPNRPASIGHTPLCRAAGTPHASRAIVELLIERGATMRACSADGRTPLHEAAAVGRLDVVALLMRNGADPRVRDREGALPEDLAAAIANYERSFDVLHASRRALERAVDAIAPRSPVAFAAD